MATITPKDGTNILYKDWGKGQPIVFSHGWSLSADDWDGQMPLFGQRGYRVITRSQPAAVLQGHHSAVLRLQPPGRKDFRGHPRTLVVAGHAGRCEGSL
jgi:hypothetical protein